jgi:hypothetical protein
VEITKIDRSSDQSPFHSAHRLFDRRGLLKMIALAPIPLAGCVPSAPAVDIPGRYFHVSTEGSDDADGLSPATAWKSINQVNAQVSNGTVRPADSVLFESGQTFFGKLRPPGGRPVGGGYLTFGSFPGTGRQDRPVISSYKVLNHPGAWQQVDATTWTLDISSDAYGRTHAGYDGSQGGGDNIGFLKVDGKIQGNRVWRTADLLAEWDFYCSDGALTVRSSADPSTVSRDIRAACDGACVSLTDALRLTGLRFEGSGGHGAQGTAIDVRIEGNEFAELGGAQLGGTTRYGNGVEIWIDSAGVLVSGNVLHDVYDSALTAQGGPASTTGAWRNITFRDNLAYLCNQSVEFWSDGVSGRDPGFVGCLVECNTFLYAGYGWSSTVRPDPEVGVHLLTYGWVLPADIKIRRNAFYDAKVAYRYTGAPTPGLDCSDNYIAQRRGTLLEVGDPRPVEHWRDWVNARNDERGSSFEALAAEAIPNVADALRRVSPPCGLPRPS